eukprot:gene22402-biopygen17737
MICQHDEQEVGRGNKGKVRGTKKSNARKRNERFFYKEIGRVRTLTVPDALQMGRVQIFQTRQLFNEFGRVTNAIKTRLSDTFLTRPIGRVVNAPERTRFWRPTREGNGGRTPSKRDGSESDVSESDADEQKVKRREGNGGRKPSKRDGSESDASESDADEQKVKRREGNGGRKPSKRDKSESDASESDADEQKVKRVRMGRVRMGRDRKGKGKEERKGGRKGHTGKGKGSEGKKDQKRDGITERAGSDGAGSDGAGSDGDEWGTEQKNWIAPDEQSDASEFLINRTRPKYSDASKYFGRVRFTRKSDASKTQSKKTRDPTHRRLFFSTKKRDCGTSRGHTSTNSCRRIGPRLMHQPPVLLGVRVRAGLLQLALGALLVFEVAAIGRAGSATGVHHGDDWMQMDSSCHGEQHGGGRTWYGLWTTFGLGGAGVVRACPVPPRLSDCPRRPARHPKAGAHARRTAVCGRVGWMRKNAGEMRLLPPPTAGRTCGAPRRGGGGRLRVPLGPFHATTTPPVSRALPSPRRHGTRGPRYSVSTAFSIHLGSPSTTGQEAFLLQGGGVARLGAKGVCYRVLHSCPEPDFTEPMPLCPKTSMVTCCIESMRGFVAGNSPPPLPPPPNIYHPLTLTEGYAGRHCVPLTRFTSQPKVWAIGTNGNTAYLGCAGTSYQAEHDGMDTSRTRAASLLRGEVRSALGTYYRGAHRQQTCKALRVLTSPRGIPPGPRAPGRLPAVGAPLPALGAPLPAPLPPLGPSTIHPSIHPSIRGGPGG